VEGGTFNEHVINVETQYNRTCKIGLFSLQQIWGVASNKLSPTADKRRSCSF